MLDSYKFHNDYCQVPQWEFWEFTSGKSVSKTHLAQKKTRNTLCLQPTGFCTHLPHWFDGRMLKFLSLKKGKTNPSWAQDYVPLQTRVLLLFEEIQETLSDSKFTTHIMRCLLNKENGRNSENVPNPRSGLPMPKTETQPGKWRAHLIPSQLIHWCCSNTKQEVTAQGGASVTRHPTVTGMVLQGFLKAKSGRE